MEIFYGSSSEQLRSVRVLADGINFGSPIIWADNFDSGVNFLETILAIAKKVHFAIFVMSGEDQLRERGVTYLAPRDNLLFEAGIFISTLGATNVFLIYPQIKIPDSEGVKDYGSKPKYLTDLSGINHIKCGALESGATQQEILRALGDVPSKIEELLKKRFVPRIRQPYVSDFFSISTYSYIEEWHAAFKKSIEKSRFDAKLSYYGPGLAQYWNELCDSDLYRKKDEDFRMILSEIINPLRLSSLSDQTGIYVVDLGVGNGRLGGMVLDRLITDIPRDRRLSYAGIDISFEMLVALSKNTKMQSTFKAMRTRGEIVGICCDFFQMNKVKEIFVDNDKAFYLLLGNTLGNESEESKLLQTIRSNMGERDYFMFDVLLKDNQEVSEAKTTSVPSDRRTFDTGPFRCFGLKPAELECFTELRSTRFGEELIFQVRCKEPKQVHHPAVSDFIIPDEIFSIMRVKRYTEEYVDEMISSSGLKAVASKITDVDAGGQKRKMKYILCMIKQ